MTHFIVYSRSYCHLCDDMIDALRKLQQEYNFTFNVSDIDQDPFLLHKYDELVPVLFGSKLVDDSEEAAQLCHYFINEKRVREYLEDNPGR